MTGRSSDEENPLFSPFPFQLNFRQSELVITHLRVLLTHWATLSPPIVARFST